MGRDERSAEAVTFAAALAALSPVLLAGPGAPDGVRIRADLLPASAWGSNLRGILTTAQWDGLRLPVCAAAAGRCQICGTARRDRRPDCHEQWSFELRSLDPGEPAIPVQRLERLVALCAGCHAIQHIGLAGLRGQMDEVRSRLARLNAWSPSQVAADISRANRRFALLEAVPWDLDLAVLAGCIEIPGFPELYIEAGAREYLPRARQVLSDRRD